MTIARHGVRICSMLILALAARADSLNMKIESAPYVSPALGFVNESTGKAFAVGREILLTRQPSRAAESVAAQGFQVRVFRLPQNGNPEPVPWETFGPCDVYVSLVYQFAPPAYDPSDYNLVLGTTDASWLEVSDRSIENGRYLLVFERLLDSSAIIRLHKDNRADYFRSGIRIEVTKGSLSDEQIAALVAEMKSRRRELVGEIKLNSPDQKCYTMKPTRVVEHDTVQLAMLDPCELTRSSPNP